MKTVPFIAIVITVGCVSLLWLDYIEEEMRGKNISRK